MTTSNSSDQNQLLLQTEKSRWNYCIKDESEIFWKDLKKQILHRYHFNKAVFQDVIAEDEEEMDINLSVKIQGAFIKIGKYNKTIRTFCEANSYFDPVMIKGFSKLKENFKMQSSLNVLELKIYDGAPSLDQSVFLISKLIKRVNSLKIVKLDIECSEFVGVTEGAIKNLARGLKTMTHLQKLELNFNKCHRFSVKVAQNLARIFKRRETLETLCLQFKECYGMEDKELQPISQGIKSLTFLKTLILKFETPFENITEQGLTSIIKAFANLTSLQTIQLMFDEKQIGETGLICLSEALKNHVHLRKFTMFCVKCCFITNFGLKSLNESLKRLPILESINIGFNISREKIDLCFENLYGGLESMDSLKNIDYIFSWCNSTNDRKLETLSQTLAKLSTLETLSLSFKGCNEVTNEGVQSISKSLKQLHLRKISLNFSYCRQITDEGVNCIIEALQGMTSLKEIDLDFSNCKKITKEMVSLLRETLKKLPSIQNVIIRALS